MFVWVGCWYRGAAKLATASSSREAGNRRKKNLTHLVLILYKMTRITFELLRKHASHNQGALISLKTLMLHQLGIEKIELINQCCRHITALYLQNNVIGRIENLYRLKVRLPTTWKAMKSCLRKLISKDDQHGTIMMKVTPSTEMCLHIRRN